MAALSWLVLIFTLITLAFGVPIYPTTNDCITYDLEDDFERQFSADRDCAGRDSWHSGKYEKFDISPPHHDSSSFVFANTTSCVRTINLQRVAAGSWFQLNVFMNTVSGMTNMFVYIYSMSDMDLGFPVSTGIMSSALFANGWHDFKVQVPTNVEQVYLVFDVFMSPESRVMIDSFRYFANEESMSTCSIYPEPPESSEEDDTSEVVTSSEETNEELESSQESVESSSEEDESEQETSCVTFDFEHNVDNLFASDLECALSTFGPWEHGAYDELDIELDSRGTRFIRPRATGSCSRTLEVFPVIHGGIIEVNVFIQMAVGSTGNAYVAVLVQNYADRSSVGVGVINSNIDGNGWHTITINISIDAEVYIVLMGAVPKESKILIDSLRSVNNTKLLDTCEIYPDEFQPGPPESSEEESSVNKSSPEISGEPVPSAESSEDESSHETSKDSISNSEEGVSESGSDKSDSSRESVQVPRSSEEDESKPESDISESSHESVQMPSSSEEDKSNPESDISESSHESVQVPSSSEEDESIPESDISKSSHESVQVPRSSEEDESKPESDISERSQESVQMPSSSEEDKSNPESDISESSHESVQVPSSSKEDESIPESDISKSSHESVQVPKSSEEDESKPGSDISESSHESVQVPSSSKEDESIPGSDKSDSSQESVQWPSKFIQKFKFKNSKVFNCIFCTFTS